MLSFLEANAVRILDTYFSVYNVKKVICGQLLLLLNLMLQEVQFKGHTHKEQGRFFCQTTGKKHPFRKPLRDPFENILRHVRPSISPAVISPLLRSGRDRDGQKNVDGNKRVSRGWGGGDPPPSALSHLFVLCIGKALRQNTKKIDRAAITTTMRETCYEKTSRR